MFHSRFNRRSFIKSVSVSTAAAVLTACAPPARKASGPHNSNKVQLVYQDCRCRGEQLKLQDFYENHPDIEVFYTPDPDNFEEKMLADMEAGTAPDVMAGCCDFFPVWAQKGYLLDLSPYVQADLDNATISDWDPAQYNAFFTGNGIQYALPKYHGALALLYNKDLFDKKKVIYPDGSWTHDDYQDAMKKLTSDTYGDSQVDQWGSMLDISWERIQVHVNGWNGHLVDPNNNKLSKMATPESLAAMEWLRARMWDDHILASPLDVKKVDPRQAFIDQHVAMVEEGSWALKDILEGAKFRFGVAPLPAGPRRKVTLATTDGFAIYAGTKFPEAAWELMKFLISKEYVLAMAQAELLQPARASMVDQWIQTIQKEYPAASRDLDLAAFADGHNQGYSVTAEVFANMEDALRLTRSAWEQIYTLGQASTDLMIETSIQVEQAQLIT
jgi:multiple sugar transport system substrate-binding protein